MQQLKRSIERAQTLFADLLTEASARGPLTVEHFVRFLSAEYHLTKGVQRYFITAAAHGDFRRKHALRRWLLEFANEEEMHYVVAGKDLERLGYEPLPEPFDVTLWHAYFRDIVVNRPLVRLGAACVLENISGGVASPAVKRALTAPFLTPDNTNFLRLHQHEAIPHGDQIVEALTNAAFDDSQVGDLVEGAGKGTVLFLRVARWAFEPDGLASIADTLKAAVSEQEKRDIGQFEMSALKAHAS